MSEDFHLHYVERGQGPTLVLLHGNGEDSSYFEHQMEVYSTHFRTIALDTRGHGLSPRGEGEFTIERFAEDLRDFMDQMGIRKASVLGFSDGANIAMRFAVLFPERVEKLVLDGGNMDVWGLKFLVLLEVVLTYWLAGLGRRFSPKANRIHELYRLMVKDPNLTEEELKSILHPTLVVAGDKDMIRDDHTRRIAFLIPHADLKILSGSHFVAQENPDDFNAVTLEFLCRT